MEAKKFKNFTTESFTWNFDGISYTFGAGQETYLEDFKALFFAKHLVDREMNRLGIVTNNQAERSRLEALCFPSAEVISAGEALDIEAKESVKKGKKEVAAEEFPDLNDE